MSLAASLNVGVSSLRAYAQGLQTVSNNIANVNTVGYKASHAQYSDTFANLLRPLVPNENNTAVKIAPTQIGGGVQVQSVSPVFSQGTIQVTSSTSDLAVAGAGFFRVRNPSSGQPFVTRAGNFRVDADGLLVTQLGYNVQGAVGARTKVVYDTTSGSYDVKGPQDNPVVTIPAGMTTESVSGVTTVDGNRDIEMPIDQAAKLAEGMTVLTSKGAIPVGTQILAIKKVERPAVGATPASTVAVVTLSRAPFSASAASEEFTAGGLTVTSTSNELLFPPDPDRPLLTEGTPITGASLPPGTVIQFARGNYVTGLPASAQPVSLGNTPATPVATATGANDDKITVPSGTLTALQVNSLIGMNVSSDAAVPSGTKVVGTETDSNGVVTITLSKSLTAFGPINGLNFSGGKTLDKTLSSVTVADSTNIEAGMVVVGTGIPNDPELGPVVVKSKPGAAVNGVYTVELMHEKSGNPVQLTTDSYSATKFAFGNQRVSLNKLPMVDSFGTVSFSLATESSRANVIGNVRVGFDHGKDFDFYGNDGNKLTGIALEAAKLGAPKIRTFNIGNDGGINVVLSNGQTFQSGMVLLQSFKDPGALIREGDNLFSGIETAGPYNGPWISDNIMNLIPSTKGLGAINGGSLELSNVDLGEEFSSMIITQRAFQAGSRVISTADQMLEEAVNLKR
jgi:flagellar hook protein FlgE